MDCTGKTVLIARKMDEDEREMKMSGVKEVSSREIKTRSGEVPMVE